MNRITRHAAILAASALAPLAHAHHGMDYAAPASAMDGLLSGLAHPVIGLDHLLFLVGAGVLAAHRPHGALLAVCFALASVLAAGARVLSPVALVGEVWVALSVVALGAAMLASRPRAGAALAGLFAMGGAIHGHVLAGDVIGAEPTPVVAYLAGLAIVQCGLALAVRAAAARVPALQPGLPARHAAGAVIALAGLLFVGLAI